MWECQLHQHWWMVPICRHCWHTTSTWSRDPDASGWGERIQLCCSASCVTCHTRTPFGDWCWWPMRRAETKDWRRSGRTEWTDQVRAYESPMPADTDTDADTADPRQLWQHLWIMCVLHGAGAVALVGISGWIAGEPLDHVVSFFRCTPILGEHWPTLHECTSC